MSTFRTIQIQRGSSGWGDGLTLTPTEDKNVILSVTNGGIHPVAQRMAELSGGRAVDGFTTPVDDADVLAAVINCGGTARIGVYPKKRIPTVDVFPGEPAGPLAQFITADIFVSDVGMREIAVVDALADAAPADAAPADAAPADATGPDTLGATGPGAPGAARPQPGLQPTGLVGLVVGFGNAIGYIINTLLSSGRQSIDIILKTVLPFMAYVALLIGFVNYTGLSELIATVVSPLASNPLGLLLLSFVVALPFLSPILGPGGAVAQVVGVLMGTQIGIGALPVQYALPTLFAIDGQVGADFVPVGLSLGEARPETISVGVPAVLFSRMITSPIAVLIAYLASFLLV